MTFTPVFPFRSKLFLARPEVRKHNRRALHKIALSPTAGVRREHSNSTTRNPNSG